MFRQNINLFFRSFTRHKFHSLITISGLVLGLTAVLLAFIFISDEKDFDTFHTKADRVFRMNKHYTPPSGERSKNAETPGLMAAALDTDFPEVEAAAHISPWFDEVLVTYEDQNIQVKNWLFADSNFFRLFDFEILRGEHRSKVLARPGQVLLTPALAQSLFGDQDPIGETIQGLNDQAFTVSGIIKEAPRQSHIQYEAIASWASTEPGSGVLDFSFMNNWLGQTVYTYTLLRQPEQITAVNQKLPEFTTRHMPNEAERYDFFLQPLSDVYLHSNDIRYLRGGKYGSAPFLKTFSIVGLLILLIACFNYINVTTARSLQRAKEVGVKKVLGAAKQQIVRQFLSETMAMTMLAAFSALVLAQLLLPKLNLWFEKDIPSNLLIQPLTLGFLLGVVLLTGMVSGLFPSLLLAKFQPVKVLRSTERLSPGGQFPRQLLTTLQLIIGVGLIAGTLLLNSQFRYLLNRDMGFDKEQVMVVHSTADIQKNVEAIQQELNNLPGVSSVSICQAAMPDGTFGTTVIPEGNNGEELPIQLFRVDSSYLKTYGIDLAEGRFLNRPSDIEPGTLVVNETFVKQMGWAEGVNKMIQFPGSEVRYPVVGVVKDFHYNSLHQPIDPIVMYLDERKHNISLRIDPQQIATLLPQVQKLWKKFEARHPFEYYFLDAFFAERYVKEKQMVGVISLFAAIAIFIACLGLYGLASFAIARRRKEIGIRKVLGATIVGIVNLLTKDFLKLVFIALFIGSPLAYYFIDQWLQDFAYRVDIQWWVFALAGALMLIIVLFTVSFQSIRAALANPVESLRSE